MQSDVVMASNDQDEDPEAEAEEITETVTAEELRNQLREVAQRDEVSALDVLGYLWLNMDCQSPEALNPHDVTWIDAEDEDEEVIAVKAISRQVPQPKRGQADTDATFGVRNLHAYLFRSLIIEYLYSDVLQTLMTT